MTNGLRKASVQQNELVVADFYHTNTEDKNYPDYHTVLFKKDDWKKLAGCVEFREKFKLIESEARDLYECLKIYFDGESKCGDATGTK